jgi:hypothetical protein
MPTFSIGLLEVFLLTFFAVFQGILKSLLVFTQISLSHPSAQKMRVLGEQYASKWTSLLIPPSTLLIINLVGVVAGISNVVNHGHQSWDSSFGELFFAFWVYCALITLSESIDGLAKLNPNNNNSVVNPSHIGILTSMGAQ